MSSKWAYSTWATSSFYREIFLSFNGAIKVLNNLASRCCLTSSISVTIWKHPSRLLNDFLVRACLNTLVLLCRIYKSTIICVHDFGHTFPCWWRLRIWWWQRVCRMMPVWWSITWLYLESLIWRTVMRSRFESPRSHQGYHTFDNSASSQDSLDIHTPWWPWWTSYHLIGIYRGGAVEPSCGRLSWFLPYPPTWRSRALHKDRILA